MKLFVPILCCATLLLTGQNVEGKHISELVKEKLAALQNVVLREQVKAKRTAALFCTSSTASASTFEPRNLLPIPFCALSSQCFNETMVQLTTVIQLKREVKNLKQEAVEQLSLIAKMKASIFNESDNLIGIKHKLSVIEGKKFAIHGSHNSAKHALSEIRSLLYNNKTLIASDENKIALSKEPLVAPILRFMEASPSATPLSKQMFEEVAKKLDQLVELLDNSTRHQTETIEEDIMEQYEKQQKSEEKISYFKNNLESAVTDRQKSALYIAEKNSLAANAYESYSRAAQYCFNQHELYVEEVFNRESEKKLFDIIISKLEAVPMFQQRAAVKNETLFQTETESMKKSPSLLLENEKKNILGKKLESHFNEKEILKAENFDGTLQNRKSQENKMLKLKSRTQASSKTPEVLKSNLTQFKQHSVSNEKKMLLGQIDRTIGLSKLVRKSLKIPKKVVKKVSLPGVGVAKQTVSALKSKYHKGRSASVSKAEEETKRFIAANNNILNLRSHE